MPVDFKIKEFFYPVSILRMRCFLEKSQWFTPEKLREYQIKRLGVILKQAYDNVPYYRNLFDSLKLKPADFKTLEDLRKLPTLTKQVIRQNASQLLARNSDKLHAKLYSTSGSTGEPIDFYLDKPANILEFCYYWRHWSWAGYRLGKRFAELTSTSFLNNNGAGQLVYRFSPLTARLQINSLTLGADNIKKYADAIRKYNPRYLNGLASSLYFFALLLKNAGINDISFDGIISQGEMLLPSYRKVIETVFHCNVLDSYGHMERTVAISQCPRGKYHINSEYGILELENKQALPGGGVIGTVVGTSLHNFSMPFIRYELNDRIELSAFDSPCACGRGLPGIKKIHGRQEDVIITPDNRIITDLFTLFDDIPGIELGQIIQETKQKLYLKIAKNKSFNQAGEQSVLNSLRKYVGSRMKIDIEYVPLEDLKRENPGKIRIIVSHIKPYVGDEINEELL